LFADKEKIMLRVLLCSLLPATTVLGAFAQSPRVIRKPVAEYVAAKSEAADQGIFRADLSPDGKLVACTRRDGKLSVYAVGDTKPLFTTGPAESRGSSFTGGAAFSADGKLVAFAVNEKRIEIVSARTGQAHASCALPGGKPEAVDALAFSPDGKKLAVSSGFLYHKDLHVFDATTGKLLGEPLHDVDGFATQLIFSGDGKRLVANHWPTVYLVDAVEHRLIKKLPAKAPTVFFRGGQLYAVQEESSAIHEVTVEGVAKKSFGRFIDKIDSASAMRTAVAGNPPVAAVPQKSEVSVRDMEGRELFRVAGEDSPIRRVCLSADGRVLLIYRDSLRVEVFRLE
jgi:DNA-binding beta-propeller fold protein YncE